MNIPFRSKLAVTYGMIIQNPVTDELTWSEQNKFLQYFSIPSPLQVYFLYAGKPTTRIAMNRDMIAPFAAALTNIQQRKCQNFIQSYDGCFNIRHTRGEESLSVHSWGLAIDLNAVANPLGGPGTMAQPLINCFTDAGFIWGGSFKDRIDPQHFQFVIEG